MLIAPRVAVLELEMDVAGTRASIHPTLAWDEREVVLFDAGLPGQLEQLRRAVEQEGVPLESVTRLIVTHQDIDHIGGLAALTAAVPRVEVLAHEAERPYITGERPLLKASPERLRQLSERLSFLPEERRRAMLDAFRNVRGRVDRTVAGGERLPYCGGIVVVHTPGHTPGHISLYLERTKTLVAGDALNVVDGELAGPSPQTAEDPAQALASVAALTPYEVDVVVCYHGGPYAGGAGRRIAELAREGA